MRKTRVLSLHRSWSLPVVAFAMDLYGSAASAQTYVVNDVTDAVDAAPADGVCETAAGSGICTLRAAIQEVNATAGDGGSNDRVIELPAGIYRLALPGRAEDLGASGDLDINTSVSIVGAGPDTTIVDGGELDRVLDIAPDPARSGLEIEVALSGLTVRGGWAGRNDEPGDSWDGGGIRYAAPLYVQDALITANVADGDGGGLASLWSAEERETSLTLLDSVVSDNRAGNRDDYGARGGGLSAGVVTIKRSQFLGNSTNEGGGGLAVGEGAVLREVVIANNRADGYGGGLVADSAAMTGIAIHDNWTNAIGGGVYIGGAQPTTIINSTLSNNVAGYEGGGLFAAGGGGQITLTHATVANNAIESGVGEGAGDAAGIMRSTGFEVRVVRVQNSIIGPNFGRRNCGYNPLTSLGGNIDSDGSCLFAEPSDLSGIDPLLGPLADNGGFAPTHELLSGSPAIDAALPLAEVVDDQRGYPRPADGDGRGAAASDIGAFERSDETSKQAKLHLLLQLLWNLLFGAIGLASA